jgi:hypothetical protein
MGSTRNIAAAVGVAAVATLMGAGIAAAATTGSGAAAPSARGPRRQHDADGHARRLPRGPGRAGGGAGRA